MINIILKSINLNIIFIYNFNFNFNKKIMNSTLKNKQCPRCRFPLSKTHSDKVICKKCGYTSVKKYLI